MTHAISRSKELLACARTAQRLLSKLADNNNNNNNNILAHAHAHAQPLRSTLSLWQQSTTNANVALEDGAIAVQATERIVEQLEKLVRQRGHTNDPTDRIEACMAEFKVCMEELMSAAMSIRQVPLNNDKGNSSSLGLFARSQLQRKKHFEVVASTIEQRGKVLTERFQSALSVRSDVLKLQAQRTKMLVTNSTSTNHNNRVNSTGAAAPVSGKGGNGIGVRSGAISNKSSGGLSLKSMDINQLNSPLFTMTGTKGAVPTSTSIVPQQQQQSNKMRVNNYVNQKSFKNTNSNDLSSKSDPAPTTAKPYSVSQIQTDMASTYMGMRRRGVKPQVSSSYYQAYSQQQSGYYNQSHIYEDEDKHNKSAQSVQQQVQQRRNARNTKHRLDNARQVESAIVELGQMFGKMASLVSQQQELVDKIEDDVESSMVQVQAGAEEIQKVFEIVQSNRGLIFKIFGLLIFFILFFKIY